MVLAVVGLGLLVTFAAVPGLRNPGLIGSFAGLFSVVAAVGVSRR